MDNMEILERIETLEDKVQKLEDTVFAPSLLSKVGKGLVNFAVAQKDAVKNVFKTKKTKIKEGLNDVKEGLENLKTEVETQAV